MSAHQFEGEAGDDPPLDGFTQERRSRPRRAQDERRQRAETWTAALFIHKLGIPLLVALATFALTSLGNRIMWPRDDIAALERKFTTRDSLMAVRVTRLEDRQDQITNRLSAIEEQMRFVAFLQCTSLRELKPNLAIDGCPTSRPKP